MKRLFICSGLGMMFFMLVWGGDQFWTEFVHLKSACSP